ncbi:MAG: type II secretion system GspH family protein [Candidatus Magnetoovum sp. WYHC-5]|nr:type II secretion system GspH family protein [Candidatus Magnetoovum sp. WYHC-5]
MIKKYTKSGFTLIEIIIAFSILSLIVIILGLTMRLSVRSVEKGEAKVEFLERLRASFRIINAQVESFVPIMYDDLGKRLYAYEAKDNSFTFYSTISLWGRAMNTINVTYSVTQANNAVSLLLKEKDMFFKKERQAYLFEGYKKIDFEYYVKKTTDAQGEWVSEVDETDTVIKMLKINLDSTKFGQQSIVIPVMAQVSKLVRPKKNTFKNEDSLEQ